MPVYNTPNYCKAILRTTHATPKTCALRTVPGVYNSQQRWPDVDDVRVGTIYGPGQFEQQEYLTGTLIAGGGSAAYRVIGSPVVRRLGR